MSWYLKLIHSGTLFNRKMLLAILSSQATVAILFYLIISKHPKRFDANVFNMVKGVWYCIWWIFTEDCDVTIVMVLQMAENPSQWVISTVKLIQ